jgi:hypothetical protein
MSSLTTRRNGSKPARFGPNLLARAATPDDSSAAKIGLSMLSPVSPAQAERITHAPNEIDLHMGGSDNLTRKYSMK